MRLPPGKTEAEVLAAIEKAVRILAPSFVFGFHGLEDIKQQARLFGLQALARYDPTRPLENFVYTHIRNRLINLRRDQLRRNDPPCKSCHQGQSCGVGPCGKYAAWLKRNNAKANLLRPLDIDYVADEREPSTQANSTVVADAELAEVLEKLDVELPVELRSAYLQLRDGVSIPRPQREKVMEAVRKILEGVIECPPRSEED